MAALAGESMRERLDLSEKGGPRGGQPQALDRRLFMQLLAFGDCRDTADLARALEAGGFEAVLYKDLNDPYGVALLTWSEQPDFFVTLLRPFLAEQPFNLLAPKPEFTMIGRSYSIGHEPDLEGWLLHRPRRTVLNRNSPWAVWYPLRRKGEVSALPLEEQGAILAEHGRIGHAFGEAGYAQDVRLACFGLDKHDHDFVIGLIGSELYPLSACVQQMRRTRQTSQYIETMGPFFVGKAFWQSPSE